MITISKVATELRVNPSVLKAILIEQGENIPYSIVGRTFAVERSAAEKLKQHYRDAHLPHHHTNGIKRGKVGVA